MKYLYSPWRMEYILEKKPKGCIFCRKPNEKDDPKNLILHKSQYAFVMMNKFPYNSGHLMIVPKRHCLSIEELKKEEMEDLFQLLQASTRILKKVLRPHGFNIGINTGKAGGAGEEHIHIHIVPRWNGDTNFMPVLIQTKVVPEYLEKTYQKLHPSFTELSQKKGRPKKGGQKK